MNITYQAIIYTPALVTGVYVRCYGSKRNGFMFKVFECASNARTGVPGQGYTLREYITDGANIPEDVKTKAIETKTTVLWEPLTIP